MSAAKMCNLLAITALVLVTLAASAAAIGRTYPAGPIYVLAGNSINITCTLDLGDPRTEGLNSSALHWFTSTGQVESRYVHIIDAATVQLYIPHAPPLKQPFTCKLRRPGGSYSGVNVIDVAVGYEPKNVHNFQCRSYNWVTMTCTFEKFENPVDSKYTLYFSVDRFDEFECTLKPVFDGTYTCTLLTDSLKGIYRQTHPYYYFTLVSVSPLGNFTENFTVDHYASVIPGPPINLNFTNVSTNGVTLSWRTPFEMQSFPADLTHAISYTSIYDAGVWHELPEHITHPHSHKHTIAYNITTLPYAYVEYDVRVRIRVRAADDTAEMWSRNATLIFRSGARVPDAPPATDAGGFYVDDNDHVYVYWRELAKHDENGPHFQYAVSSDAATATPPLTTTFMAKYTSVERNRYEDLTFAIRSANAMGASLNASRIRVPRRARRCAQPGEIRNILHAKNDPDRHYVFSWRRHTNATTAGDDQPPATGHHHHQQQQQQHITSYTVFWCKARNESPNQCDGAFDFTRVSADTNSFTLATNDTLNFAVAANSPDSSSGMTWARCTAIANNDINKVTDAKPTVGSDTATLEWNTACIDESLSHGYIITYCLVQGERDNSNCSEPASNVTINGAAIHNYTLPALIPYRTYKVNIAAKSTERIGPLSDPVYFTTLEASPSAPRALMVLNLNASAATLQWDPPAQMNGVLNRYIVYYNAHKYDQPKPGNASERMQMTLHGLEANTDYKITIKACTGARLCSEASNTVAARTDVGPPGAVRLLATVPAGEIGWQRPLVAGGNLDYYELDMVEYDGGARRTVYINGTRCRLAVPMCQTGEESYAFRVRAVNVMWGAHSAHAIGQQHQQQQQQQQQQHGRQHHESDAEQHGAHAHRRALGGSGGGGASIASLLGNVTAMADRLSSSTALAAATTTVQSMLLAGGAGDPAQRICVEEDATLVQRIRARDEYASFYEGEWLVVKNQDCRTTNRTMFAVMTAMLLAVVLVAYLIGTFAFKKLKRMKDIEVELPEGLQDIIAEAVGGDGGKGKLACGGGRENGSLGGHANGMSGGGVVLGGRMMDRQAVGGRMLDAAAACAAGGAAEKKLFLSGGGGGGANHRSAAAELDESLLPLAQERSMSHSSAGELDDEELRMLGGGGGGGSGGGLSERRVNSSGDSSLGLRSVDSHSHDDDSDGGMGGGVHDGSSGRTLLMGSNQHMNKFFGGSSSPMITAGKFTAAAAHMAPIFVQPPAGGASAPHQQPMSPSADSMCSGYVAAPAYPSRPTQLPFQSATFHPTAAAVAQPPTNANGYVTHESLAAVAVAPMAAHQTQAAAAGSTMPTTMSLEQANLNGYLPWNAITASALSAATSAQSTTPAATGAATTPATDADAGKFDQKPAPANAGSVLPSPAESTAAAAAVATGISGYVTHKQLSDFGQLIQ